MYRMDHSALSKYNLIESSLSSFGLFLAFARVLSGSNYVLGVCSEKPPLCLLRATLQKLLLPKNKHSLVS